MPSDDIARQKRRHAKTAARRTMEEVARGGDTIDYSKLVDSFPPQATNYAPNSLELAAVLSEISRKTHAEGHGLLSAVVVNQQTGLPGAGFFALAADVGCDVKDQRDFWTDAVQKVWKAAGAPQWV